MSLKPDSMSVCPTSFLKLSFSAIGDEVVKLNVKIDIFNS